MKFIIAGSRGFIDGDKLDSIMDELEQQYDIDEVVVGGAKGADTHGENWGLGAGLPTKVFPANWDAHGRAAGHLRNADMAEYADALVAFWDGTSKGTRGMINDALVYQLSPIIIFIEDN